MALTVGSRLSHYDVTALIGEGGMGQVYQATDTKLNRQVALKILPEAFAADPDRLARFQREAHVLASLNHPNIAQIHGLEESDGIRALVLELVEGPTLADRIAQGPIPVDEALPIAKQIAEALEAAHEAGVIHRDLKPANIKVRDDGTVKVLDFGLAKALDTTPQGDPSLSPTLTAAATQMGVIMGTAAYMSPEQARGKTVDKRADIWAFGAVLFEMLTGKRAFEGEDVSVTLADVIRAEVSWEKLPSDLPSGLTTYLHRCLQKEPSQRIQAFGDVRLALDGAFESTVNPVAEPNVASRLQVWQRSMPLAVAALVIAAIAGGLAVVVAGIASGFGVWSTTRSEAPGVVRFQIPVPLDTSRYGSSLLERNVTTAPDGSFVVYMAPDRSMLRYIDSEEETAIPGAIGGSNPVVSPDGKWIGFWANGQLKKVSVNGGGSMRLCDVGLTIGISWGPDDTILFAQTDGVWRVPGAGGVCEKVIDVGEGELLGFPRMLPGTDWLLMTAGLPPNQRVVVQSLATEERTVLLEDRGVDARYLTSGHLVYQSDDALRAVPFDLASRSVTGGPVTLVEGLVSEGVPQVGLSEAGTLAYLTRGDISSANRLVWVDRQGNEELLSLQPADYLAPRVSPDGRRVAVGTRDSSAVLDEDIYIHDLTRGGLERLTLEGGNRWPVWTGP